MTEQNRSFTISNRQKLFFAPQMRQSVAKISTYRSLVCVSWQIRPKLRHVRPSKRHITAANPRSRTTAAPPLSPRIPDADHSARNHPHRRVPPTSLAARHTDQHSPVSAKPSSAPARSRPTCMTILLAPHRSRPARHRRHLARPRPVSRFRSTGVEAPRRIRHRSRALGSLRQIRQPKRRSDARRPHPRSHPHVQHLRRLQLYASRRNPIHRQLGIASSDANAITGFDDLNAFLTRPPISPNRFLLRASQP